MEGMGRDSSSKLITLDFFPGKFSELESMVEHVLIVCGFSFTGVLNISVSPDKRKIFEKYYLYL